MTKIGIQSHKSALLSHQALIIQCPSFPPHGILLQDSVGILAFVKDAQGHRDEAEVRERHREGQREIVCVCVHMFVCACVYMSVYMCVYVIKRETRQW